MSNHDTINRVQAQIAKGGVMVAFFKEPIEALLSVIRDQENRILRIEKRLGSDAGEL